MIDKSKAIDAEFTVKPQPKASTGRNPFHEAPVDASFKAKRSKKEAFFHVAKKTGSGLLKATKATAKGSAKTLKYGSKVLDETGRKTEAVYRGVGRINLAHRVRVLEKSKYKSAVLEQRVVRHNLKQQLPQGPKRTYHPLSDKGLKTIRVGGNKGKKKGGFFA